MNRERIAQLVGWLGLAWLLFVAAFFVLTGDNSTILNSLLGWVGLR